MHKCSPSARQRAADDARATAYAFAASRGEGSAMEALVRATREDVWRFVAHLTDAESADDLTQETYVRALRGLPRFAGRSHVRGWLLGIARRVVVDHYRSTATRPRTADADWRLALDRRACGGVGFEEEFALAELLEQLDGDRREAFLLTQIAGFSYAEAAAMVGCPVGTVRSRVARARADLTSTLYSALP